MIVVRLYDKTGRVTQQSAKTVSYIVLLEREREKCFI